MSLRVVGFGTLAGHGVGGLSPKPTCLIVEDQALIGLSLEAYLEEIGFGTCGTFLSAADALAWLAWNTPTIAILDYSLKDGPCTGLVRTLRKRRIPFVIYSGHKREIACQALQDVPWLNKPCDRAALLAALIQMVPTFAQPSVIIAA